MKSTNIKERERETGLHQNQTFCSSKASIKKVKKQATDWNKIFKISISDN